MQIVIEISEDSYKATCNECMLPPDVTNVIEAITNGTPLPEKHGRLIDADALRRKWVFDRADVEEIDEAPTILGATESEEQA